MKDSNNANGEEMIRDPVFFGIHSLRVREKLLNIGSVLAHQGYQLWMSLQMSLKELFPGECTFHIDPKAVPVVHPPRRA